MVGFSDGRIIHPDDLDEYQRGVRLAELVFDLVFERLVICVERGQEFELAVRIKGERSVAVIRHQTTAGWGDHRRQLRIDVSFGVEVVEKHIERRKWCIFISCYRVVISDGRRVECH